MTAQNHHTPTPMSDAELRVTRERLGLTADALADLLEVQSRSVRRWESGERIVPDAVRERLTEMERVAAARVGRAVEALQAGADPGLLTYRTDEDLWGARPDDRPMPASWHRAIVARILEEVPGVSVSYAPPATRLPGTPMRSGMVSLAEAAELLGHSPDQAVRMLAAENVINVRPGGRGAYARAEVEALRQRLA